MIDLRQYSLACFWLLNSLCYCRNNGVGPIRSKPRGGKPAPKEKKAKATPKSAEELDMELDAFMKDDVAPAAAAPGSTSAPTEDVEMKA